MNASQSSRAVGGNPTPPDREMADLRSRERCLLVEELGDELAHHLMVILLQVMGHSDAELADESRTALLNAGRAAESGLGRLRLLNRVLADGGTRSCRTDVASLTGPTPPSVAAVRASSRPRHCGLGLHWSIPAWVDDLDPISQRTLSRTLDELVATSHDPASERLSYLSVTVEDERVVLNCRLPSRDPGEPVPDLRGLAERVDLTGGHLNSTRSEGIWQLTLALSCTLPREATPPEGDEPLLS